jgi:tetratricopeptide (TPR) repeat protein
LDEALKHYDLAVKFSHSEDGLYLYNRGQVKQRLNQIKEAIEDFSNALIKLSEQDYLY